MSQETYYRTTPARTAKMMAIMLGICIVGGAIFFVLWDYWISEHAPVVEMMAAMEKANKPYTGDSIKDTLSFVNSDDLSEMGFNALPGQPGHNPTINMSVGDKLLLNVENDGTTPHTFTITKNLTGTDSLVHGLDPDTGNIFLWWVNDQGVDTLIPGVEVNMPDTTLGPGFSEFVEFIPAEEGVFYYICTIPGHRESGLSGEIIVGTPEVQAAASGPTGVSHEFTLDFVESADFLTLAFNALPGEEGTNPEIRVNSGDEVTINSTNLGKTFHSFGVVSNPDDYTSVVWDSAIASFSNPLKGGEGGQTTFLAGAPGTYYYICTVPGHAALGMQGTFIVE